MWRIRSFFQKTMGRGHTQVFLLFVFFFVLGVTLTPEPAHAGLTDDLLRGIQTGIAGLADIIIGSLIGLINGILAAIIAILGWLISFAVDVLKMVASYKEFSTQRQVSILWALVRDVMNSFFIVVLIVIAFATIIRWQPWQFKATLPKFIIAAIIINFSKTICLLAINFSTAIMMTFITAIGDSWPAFVLALRAPATVSFSSDTLGGIFGSFTKSARRGVGTGDLAVSALTTLVTSLFSILILVVALFAILIFVFILLWRVIMLWMLMILSPAAFFLWAVPGRGAGYFKQWLDEFIKEVLIGPVIALMLYLDITFFVQNIRATADGTLYGFKTGTFLTEVPAAVLTLIGKPEILFGYLVGLAFIFVSVEITMKIGAKSVGLGTKTGKAAGAAGLWARDWARQSALRGGVLSKIPGAGSIAPFIPWTPIDSTKGILTGLANKRNKWNEDARKAQLGYAAKQLSADKPGRARAFLARLNAGDVELGENLTGELKAAVGSAASVIDVGIPGTGKILPGRAGDYLQGVSQKIASYQESTRDINSRLGTYDAHDAIRSGFDENMQAKFGNYTLDGFNERFGALKEADSIAGLREERDQIQDNIANGVYAGDPEQAQEAIARGNEIQNEIDSYENSYTQAERDSLEAELGDLEAYEKASEMFDKQDVYQQDVGVRETFGQIASKISGDTYKKEQLEQRKKDTSEFLSRSSSAADALSSVRSDYQKARLDYMKKEYPVEEEVDTSTIFNRVLSHQNPEDRAKLSGDLVQAARQGDGQEVLRKFGESVGQEFSFTSKGMQNLVNHLSDVNGVGLTKDEAMELVADMQKINYEEGRLAQGDFVKRDRTGKRTIVSEAKRAASIERNLTKKSLIKTLREGKKDAFGAEDAKGKFSVHPGATKAIKKQKRQLTTILNDDRLAVQIPDRMLAMLEDNAEAFGISDQLGRIQALRQ